MKRLSSPEPPRDEKKRRVSAAFFDIPTDARTVQGPFALMKTILAISICLIFAALTLRASQVVVYEGSYKITALRDSDLSRSERVQRCYLVVDVQPGRPASSEVLMSLLVYGAPNGSKQQWLPTFGTAADTTENPEELFSTVYSGFPNPLPRLVVENGIRALALNRLDGAGSVILAYAERRPRFAFENSMVRLKGDWKRLLPGELVSLPDLPRVLTGRLTDLTVDDLVFFPSTISRSHFNEAMISVGRNRTLTTGFQDEQLTVFQAIERLSTLLETKGYPPVAK